jgi:outer membrane protein OmpA-like peptidoglycan-associated protein
MSLRPWPRHAILELQGFADLRGSDRYNRELARERVEVVMRYLVQRHGIELRQLRAISVGKVALDAGEKASPEALPGPGAWTPGCSRHGPPGKMP